MSEQTQQSATNAFPSRAIIRFAAGLGFLVQTCLLAPAAANDKYVPYIESLQVAQKRAYAMAAPNGQDMQAQEGQPLTIHAELSVPGQPESRLEERADDRTGPLNLNETQEDQVLNVQLAQFGYDLFTQVPTTFAPVAGVPVPSDYRIGPGDQLIVQLYGKRNVEYQLIVTRDGQILVPEYGPISVAGLTFDEAEQLVTEGFDQRVIGARAVVTMGKLRSIQVRLTGDVVQPGSYTINGLSTLIDALLSTGGVRNTGTLRNIQLIRAGKTVAALDLYDLLLRGKVKEDPYLRHNDTIFVPPLGPVAYIGGEVQRPAIYELRGPAEVGDVIQMAGGLLPEASLADSHIERIQASGFRTLIDFANAQDSTAMLATAVSNGDFIRILSLEEELENVVLLSGQVDRPGGYQYRQDMRVTDLVAGVDALLPGADLQFALIRRQHPATLRTQVLYVNLVAALEAPGSVHDRKLRPRDEVIVFDLAGDRQQALAGVLDAMRIEANDRHVARIVETNGALRFNGTLPLEDDVKLLDVVSASGGLTVGADLHYALVARTQFPSRRISLFSVSLAAAMRAPESGSNVNMLPGDRIYVFNEDQDREALIQSELDRLRTQASLAVGEKLVSVLGEVLNGGTFPLEPQMRASDLLCATSGLSRKAYGLVAELSRIQYAADSDNAAVHLTLDSMTLLKICHAKREMHRGELEKEAYLSAYLDDQSNPLLRSSDRLIFTQKAGWVEQALVTLGGEVTHPGVYAIDRGETLCSVLQRAGGVTKDAYLFGAVFTRESVRQMQQQTIDGLHDRLDDLMVDLSLSHSFNNQEKSSHEWAGKQDYLKTIRQLERAKANGRMVIDLERILTCRPGRDLVLENGDTLTLSVKPDYVQVAGQVYVPTSHLFREDRKIDDYVELSGGHTLLGRLHHTYVIQANGEVLNLQGKRKSARIARKVVMPGARIYVPLNVDRMNGTEKAQTWVQTLVNSAILAGVVL